ncbi:MAG: hypothetical protein ACP5IA_04255 [Sediminispirochaetaceae bacterium]
MQKVFSACNLAGKSRAPVLERSASVIERGETARKTAAPVLERSASVIERGA